MEDKATQYIYEWLARLQSLDDLFRELIVWGFLFCVLGVSAYNAILYTNPPLAIQFMFGFPYLNLYAGSVP